MNLPDLRVRFIRGVPVAVFFCAACDRAINNAAKANVLWQEDEHEPPRVLHKRCDRRVRQAGERRLNQWEDLTCFAGYLNYGLGIEKDAVQQARTRGWLPLAAVDAAVGRAPDPGSLDEAA